MLILDWAVVAHIQRWLSDRVTPLVYRRAEKSYLWGMDCDLSHYPLDLSSTWTSSYKKGPIVSSAPNTVASTVTPNFTFVFRSARL